MERFRWPSPAINLDPSWVYGAKAKVYYTTRALIALGDLRLQHTPWGLNLSYLSGVRFLPEIRDAC